MAYGDFQSDSFYENSYDALNDNLFANLQVLKDPQVLIIKPGNTCNSACRTCIPETSSSLYSDYYKLYAEKNAESDKAAAILEQENKALQKQADQYRAINKQMVLNRNILRKLLRHVAKEVQADS